jgi:hypothetical protein
MGDPPSKITSAIIDKKRTDWQEMTITLRESTTAAKAGRLLKS